MKRFTASITAALMALSPLGAQTPAPDGGTISFETKADDVVGATAAAVFANAAGDAFAARGFTVLPDPGHAAYVVQLIIHRADVGTGAVKAPHEKVSAAPGGAYGSVGAGVTIPLSTGKSTLVALQRTELEMRMTKRGAGGMVWHGAAVTVRPARTREGADEAVSRALSEAIVSAYPTQREGIVGVP